MRRNVDATNQSLPPQFKIQKMIDTRFINSAVLETVTTSIFSVPGLAQNSNEMKKLLQVVVQMVMNVKTNTNTNTILSWNPKIWLSNRLCDTLVELMVGELNVTNIHSMVYYIIDAIQSLGVTPDIKEKLINLPWTSTSRLIEMKIASVIASENDEVQ